MDRRSRRLQLTVFVTITYAPIWLLFGTARLFDIPFTYDPGQLGGVLVLIGVPASLIGAIFTTLITGGRDGLRHLFQRSLSLRFAPRLALAAVLIPLGVTAASTISTVLISGAELPDSWFSPSMPYSFMIFFLIYKTHTINFQLLNSNILSYR